MENFVITKIQNAMEQREMKMVYDTLLSAPGMSESVKVDIRLTRREILLLTQLLEKGLSVKGEGFADLALEEERQCILEVSTAMLEKSGLSTTVAHLKGLLLSWQKVK